MGVGELTKSVGKFNNDNNELPNGVGELPNDVSKLVVDNLMCLQNDCEQLFFAALSKNKTSKIVFALLLSRNASLC